MTTATETTACPDWHCRDALRRLLPDLPPPDHCRHPQCPTDEEQRDA